MARPTKPRDVRRVRTVIFRVTLAEFEKLERLAANADLRVNELVRVLSLSKAENVVIKVGAASDPALIKRLDRIAHNLNQLVKNAHIFGRVSPKVEELCDLITEIACEAAEQESNQ